MACSSPILRIARIAGVCVLLLGAALVSQAFTEVDRPLALVNTVGSLTVVNTGQVSPWDMKSVDPAGALGGFGAAAFASYRSTGYETTGEMLSFCGRTFVRVTNPKGDPKVVETTKPFNSPFAMMISQYPDSKFAGTMFADVFPRTYRVDGEEPRLLHTVLEQLANEAHSPIAVIGWVSMPEVDGVALKKAPIGNQPLYGDTKDALLERVQATNANVVFFAVVAPRLAPSTIDNALLASKAFDFDPDQGQPASALIHVHGALVDQPVPIPSVITSPMLIDGLKTVTVKDIFHVYGTSSITNGAFMVYRLRYR